MRHGLQRSFRRHFRRSGQLRRRPRTSPSRFPSGQAIVARIPDSVTRFRVITDSGSGTLYGGKGQGNRWRGGGKAFVFGGRSSPAAAGRRGRHYRTQIPSSGTMRYGLSSSGGLLRHGPTGPGGVVMTPGGSPTVESRQVTFSPCVHLDRPLDQYLGPMDPSLEGRTKLQYSWPLAIHTGGMVCSSNMPETPRAPKALSVWPGLYAPTNGFTYFAGGNRAITATANETMDVPRVLTFRHDFSRTSAENGSSTSMSRLSALNLPTDTTAHHANGTLYIGRRYGSSSYHWHRIMGLVIVKRALSAGGSLRSKLPPDSVRAPYFILGVELQGLSTSGRATLKVTPMNVLQDPIRQYAGAE